MFKSARLWLALLCALVLFGGYKLADHFAPPQHLPWKPLSLNDDMGWATKTQLLKLSLTKRAQCVSLIETEAKNTDYLVLESKSAERGCGWDVALTATQNNGIRFSPPEVTNLCPMTAANHIWLREVDQLSREIFASALARVHHYGTYSCRNIAGSSQLSEHAFANAWDIAAFELKDGRMISVQGDWNEGGARAKFLKGARDKACRLYRVVLSPDYNQAHSDHLHLDMGPSTSCH